MMLLAQVPLVGRDIQAGYHLGRLLGGHAATDFLGFGFEYFPVVGKSAFRSVF